MKFDSCCLHYKFLNSLFIEIVLIGRHRHSYNFPLQPYVSQRLAAPSNCDGLFHDSEPAKDAKDSVVLCRAHIFQSVWAVTRST